MGAELLKLLAAAGLAATVALHLVGPCLQRLADIRDGRDPLVNSFRSIYTRAERFADETDR